jgi:crotonobetainyl-CoA:carnitine CoA-transferase CaiB-like acyl-CoA transferase
MKPLQHLTILDLSRVLACPFASMILAELGATVIKVEQPGVGDETRSFDPKLAKDSPYYFACNRSKSSITVNLRSREGQGVIRELAAGVDVVVENFPTDSLARYALDYAALSALNPRLIYVSCTGFGQTGPYSHKKGYDTVFQAMGGLMSLTGEKDRGPVKAGLPLADLTSGLWVATGILAMLSGREKTGRGSYLDFSMLDGQVSLLTLAAARYFALGEVPERMGTEHAGRVPSAAFCCKDGKYVQLTASDQHWAPLCEALGISEWGLRFSSNEKRVEGRDEVMQRLTQAVSGMERQKLLEILDKAEVPVGPINDVADILGDPHVRARQLVGSFDYPEVGEFKALAIPYRFLGWDNPEIGTPPALGADTDRILAERLGYSREKIAALRAAKAI